MPEPDDVQKLSPKTIALVICGVLGAVILGTLFTMRFEGPRPSHLPTALGHDPVPVKAPAPPK